MTSPILITGVGKRVGLALARHFLGQGTPVVGTYRTHYQSIDELAEAGATLYQIDFYQQQELDSFIEQVRQKHPVLRGIIHNASDWMTEKDGADPADLFHKMMQVHASVPYQLNRALQPNLLADNGQLKDIIHISDYITGKGSKKHIAYAASKAALDNLTLSFAAAFAPDIKVNTIAPALLQFNEGDSDEYKKKAVAKALLPKEGGFDEVVTAVEFIIKSRYMTGRTIYLDGGRHLA